MKTILTFLIFFFLVPQNDSDRIFWSETRKLTWEDFKGSPLPNANFVASTNTGINFSYSYSIENHEVILNYTVESFFDPQKSWYIPNQVSPLILKHEQTHFDISELHARILKKRLSEKKFSRKVKSEIETIYRKVEQERRIMQRKFDAETDHSRNIKNELHWQTHIAKQLAEYNGRD